MYTGQPNSFSISGVGRYQGHAASPTNRSRDLADTFIKKRRVSITSVQEVKWKREQYKRYQGCRYIK